MGIDDNSHNTEADFFWLNALPIANQDTISWIAGSGTFDNFAHKIYVGLLMTDE